MFRPACLIGLVVIVGCAGCNSKSPTSPTPVATPSPAPPAPQPPAVVTVTVAGVLTDAHSSRPVGGATVRIGSAQSSTDGNGYFSLGGVSPGDATITATAANYNTASERFTVGTTDTRRDLRIVPFWTHSGIGNTVFDMPNYVQRVRIQGVWNRQSTSNFIVRLRGLSLINEILRESITYDGVHLVTGGGTVQIVSSAQIAWTFTQTQ